MNSSIFNGGSATCRALEAQSPVKLVSRSSSQQVELEMKLSSLKKDYADLHSVLVEAAQVHRQVCAPHLVRHGNFEIASEIFAVRHIPGDFFTVSEVTDGLVFALGDITGKGLAAGMWTTYLVGLVGAQIALNPSPEIVVEGVNKDACRMVPAPLSSLFLGRLHTSTGRLEYCSAGHPPALLLRADGELERLSDGGPLLGVVPTARFVRGSVDLLHGDLLLVCSDGILESNNRDDQEFGYDRLETQFRSAQNESPTNVLFSVLGAVQDFAAANPLVDDMSVAVVAHRFTPQRGAEITKH
jgi:sigma-B regulation protein RsbU (phosphoserine phosphatase)